MVFKITVFALSYDIDSYSNSNAPKLLTCIAPNKCAIASFVYLGSTRFARESGVLVVLGGCPTGCCGLCSHCLHSFVHIASIGGCPTGCCGLCSHSQRLRNHQWRRLDSMQWNTPMQWNNSIGCNGTLLYYCYGTLLYYCYTLKYVPWLNDICAVTHIGSATAANIASHGT